MRGAVAERLLAVLLLLCLGLVSVWLLAARQAARGFDPLRLGLEDFVGFRPEHPDWKIRRVYARQTPTEPTITAYELIPAERMARPGTEPTVQQAPVLVRIVHGYNMVDCMRIKHYEVALLLDTRQAQESAAAGSTDAGGGVPMQVWRVTDTEGVGRVWISSMLRASDFSATLVDTRDMAFPRIGAPDDPAYVPTGLSWRSFRHPIRNFRQFLRAQWNASRADVLTFLRLRRPAWASDVLVTMVSEYRGRDASERTDADMLPHVRAAHQAFYQSLHRFAASGD